MLVCYLVIFIYLFFPQYFLFDFIPILCFFSRSFVYLTVRFRMCMGCPVMLANLFVAEKVVVGVWLKMPIYRPDFCQECRIFGPNLRLKNVRVRAI